MQLAWKDNRIQMEVAHSNNNFTSFILGIKEDLSVLQNLY